MARMGHDSPRAAMIYQHATVDADAAIAAAVNELLGDEAPQNNTDDHDEDDDGGSAGVLAPVG